MSPTALQVLFATFPGKPASADIKKLWDAQVGIYFAPDRRAAQPSAASFAFSRRSYAAFVVLLFRMRLSGSVCMCAARAARRRAHRSSRGAKGANRARTEA
eukprot:2188009-Pleurochrysis_carterae.AAC.1